MLIWLLIIGIAAFAAWWFWPRKSTNGSKTPTPTTEKIINRPTGETKEEYELDFIYSPEWRGKRSGYVFKNGRKGQGYYKDKKVSFSTEEALSFHKNESPARMGARYKKHGSTAISSIM